MVGALLFLFLINFDGWNIIFWFLITSRYHPLSLIVSLSSYPNSDLPNLAIAATPLKDLSNFSVCLSYAKLRSEVGYLG